MRPRWRGRDGRSPGVAFYRMSQVRQHHRRLRPKSEYGRLVGLAAVWILVGWAEAGKVVLKISAVNPTDRAQRKEVRSNLPPGVGTNDVLHLDGMELRYDVQNDLYYVYRDIQLDPKARVDFRVELRDVWEIPRETLDKLERHAEKLAHTLSRTDFASVGEELKNSVLRGLAKVQEEQSKASLAAGAKVLQHIRVYYANLETLKDIRNQIGHLENLVLGTRQDPGELLGGLREVPPPNRNIEPDPAEYKTCVYQIKVHNPSTTVARKISLRRDLPREVRAVDIVDAGGLEVATDARRGVCYFYKENVEIPPGESVTFTAKIRDRWNINRPRIRLLRTRAQNLQKTMAPLGVTTVDQAIQDILQDIAALDQEPTPSTLSDQYVAFFRNQAERLDRLEERLYRLQFALRETHRRKGFEIQAPSRKTVWLIIYVILGFLAVVSLLFFLRWYGRSKAEKFDVA